MTGDITLTLPALRDVQTAVTEYIQREELRSRADPNINRRIVHARKVERSRQALSVITHALSTPLEDA